MKAPPESAIPGGDKQEAPPSVPPSASGVEISPTAIVIVHEEGRFSEGMKRVLKKEGFDVSAFTTGGAYLSQPAAKGPVCAVVNLDLNDIPGLELQRRLSAMGRGQQIVFITTVGSYSSCVAAMKGGASDYLLRPVDAPHFLKSVREALVKSDKWWHKKSRQARAALLVSKLTRRQREVMNHIIRGHTNRTIASNLGITEATVKIHRRHILEKLHVKSFPEIFIITQIAAGAYNPPEGGK